MNAQPIIAWLHRTPTTTVVDHRIGYGRMVSADNPHIVTAAERFARQP